MILSIEEIIEKVKPIAEKYNLKEVYLFGSYARGEAREESDVDLLYIKKDNSMSLLTKYKMLSEFEESLGKKVDLVSATALELNKEIPGTQTIEDNIEKDKEILFVA